MITSMLYIVSTAENSKRIAPSAIPVRLIAKGRDSAPAPSVALQRLETDPGWNLSHRRLLCVVPSPDGDIVDGDGGCSSTFDDPSSDDGASSWPSSSVTSMLMMCSSLEDMAFELSSRGDMDVGRCLSEWSIIPEYFNVNRVMMLLFVLFCQKKNDQKNKK